MKSAQQLVSDMCEMLGVANTLTFLDKLAPEEGAEIISLLLALDTESRKRIKVKILERINEM